MSYTVYSDETYFLGGQDLEMVTIGNLLQSRAVAYFDAGLNWGARAAIPS